MECLIGNMFPVLVENPEHKIGCWFSVFFVGVLLDTGPGRIKKSTLYTNPCPLATRDSPRLTAIEFPNGLGIHHAGRV